VWLVKIRSATSKKTIEKKLKKSEREGKMETNEEIKLNLSMHVALRVR
jgi:hypothetical protein